MATTAPKESSTQVAIIGMACLFPKAPDLDMFWQNILGKVDAVTDPPRESWNPDIYYDPASSETDRIYCKRGGFLGDLVRFDPISNSVPPNSVGGEPDQWLALQLARDALVDAGYPEPEEDIRAKTSVILGRGATFNGGTAISVQHSLGVAQTLNIIKSLHPEYTEADFEAIRSGLRNNLPAMGPDIVPGLVPNIVAGRIANRLDLMGPSFTVDAACASSMVAVQIAVRDLINGDCELALAGGSQVWTPMPMLSVFCQLDALSHREQIRPFDKDADGTILGEGLGILVLKRLADAEADGDRIYSVIRGMGVASDGRAVGVMAPRVEGEELAIRRAYEQAGISPETVELIEAHGTGTPVGDLAEVRALRNVFGDRTKRLPSVALGSVKSMISHTVPAAGVAGLIKTSLALYHKVLPPTLNFEAPNPEFELEKTPFYINVEPRPWINGESHPRRAGVSAFGFGGIDTHAVLEEHPSGGPREGRGLPGHLPAWDSETCVIGAADAEQLVKRIRDLRAFTSAADYQQSVRLENVAFSLANRLEGAAAEPHRLAVVATSIADLDDKLARAEERLADPGCRQIQERGGIYYYREPLGISGKLAVLFPGEGSQYPNMMADLCLHFQEVRACFDDIDRMYLEGGRREVPSDFIFPQSTLSPEDKIWTESELWDMDVAAAAVLTADEAVFTLLTGLGIRADAYAGHSSGEWAALRAAGVFGTSKQARRTWIAAELLDVYRQTIDEDHIPGAVLLAVGAGRAEVESIVQRLGDRARIAMDNCPHQVVVAVEPALQPVLMDEIARHQLVAERLPFDRPYHTPLFQAYSERLHRTIKQLDFQAPKTPIYSCATAELFDADGERIRRLTAEQWVKEVKFRETIEKLYERGFRLFVESGPRGNLTSFVEDILRGRPHCAVSADLARRSGIQQLNHMTAMLAAHGLDLDLDYLFRWRSPNPIDLDHQPESPPAKGLLLHTQFPEMKLPEELAANLRDRRGEPATEPVSGLSSFPPSAVANGAAPELPAETAPRSRSNQDQTVVDGFLGTMERFLEVQERVMLAYFAGGDTVEAPRRSPAGVSHREVAAAKAEAPVQAAQTEVVENAGAPQSSDGGNVGLPSGASVDLDRLLVGIVSDRTGYPVEAIGLDLDLEADLGIDSIKRVEIIGTFRQAANRAELGMEQLTGRRTLRSLIEAFGPE